MDPSLFKFIWKNSRRQQLTVLAIIVLSLPFYFASFDIPKRIINDALQGKAFAKPDAMVRFLELSIPLPDFLGGTIQLSEGYLVTQIGLLWGLSIVFLLFVMINGAFKYYVNVQKGVLGERLLRRMRFTLMDQYMRFRPEDIRGVKPAEAASIIKDEVDPIGNFSGDAFILPAFLAMQAMTALIFILVQSLWLGLVAFVVVLIQAVVIPILRREQLRLTQLRQMESRKLAGRVGEIVETTPAIQVNGSGAYMRAEIGSRLATLFNIRVDLFRRKFAVKYLNNLLAQVTPFFFYTIGGYLALTGALNLGQLVAAIAAYKDLPPPIKELIDWDQSRADVVVKYEQITAQFPTTLLPENDDKCSVIHTPDDAPLMFSALRVVDKRGTSLLDSLTLTLPRPAHIAVVGTSGSGRDALIRVLGRQMSNYHGQISIGNSTWTQPNHSKNNVLMSYAGFDPFLSSGTLRKNLIAPLLRQPDELKHDDDPVARLWRKEALLSGTPVSIPTEGWINPHCAGVSTMDELEERLQSVLTCTGLAEEVYRLGLLSKIDIVAEHELVNRIPAARELIFKNLKEKDLNHLVEPLDPSRFNQNATLAENLIFGRQIGTRFTEGRFASDSYLRSILEAESLLLPLINMGVAMAETAIEIFADLAPGDPLFARFSYISLEDMPEYQRLVDQARARNNVSEMSREGQSRLIELAFTYLETRHRLQLITPDLQARVLRARESFRRHLPSSYGPDIEFYYPDRYIVSGTLQDNLLFGRISFDAPDALNRVQEVAKASLHQLGLDRDVNRLGLSHEIGPSGKFLQAEQRASLSLARALLPQAAIVVLDGALASLNRSEAAQILKNIREEMAGRTLIVSLSDIELAETFNTTLVFDGPRLVESRLGGSLSQKNAVSG